MAVKPITNPYPKSQGSRTGELGRAGDLSTRGWQHRNIDTGNERQVRMTKDFTRNFATTLKDIDSTLMGHLKTNMAPQMKVREAGETIPIPIYYGNEERWANIQKHGALRDKNGSLLLPAVVFKRTNVGFTDTMPYSHDWDVEGSRILITRSAQWSKENRYDRFSVQQGKKPAIERLTTGAPDWVDVSYEFVCLTNYTEQMNKIIETFVYHENTPFGNSTNYKFMGYAEGGFSDASEIEVGSERVIKTTFTWLLKGYLLPQTSKQQIQGHIFELGKTISPSKVVFGFEGDATDTQVGK